LGLTEERREVRQLPTVNFGQTENQDYNDGTQALR